MAVNRVVLVGRLTRDPELRKLLLILASYHSPLLWMEFHLEMERQMSLSSLVLLGETLLKMSLNSLTREALSLWMEDFSKEPICLRTIGKSVL